MTTDPKPMSEEKLAAIQAALQKAKHNAPPMLLEAVAEVRRLRAREKVLHEAVRKLYDVSMLPEQHMCAFCHGEWGMHQLGRHAPNCPAAPVEDQR